jgi:hypothetical protein
MRGGGTGCICGSSVTELKIRVRSVRLHEGVGYPHGPDNHDVHEQRYKHNLLIEAYELVVFCEAVVD